MQNHTVALQAVTAGAHHLSDTLIEGVTEGHMRDYATLKVGPWTHTLGTINDLVGDDKVARLDSLLETANSRESDDATDTDGPQSSNIRAGRDFVRGNLVVETVAAQESDGDDLIIVLAVVVKDSDR